jgi:hypothetical protein
MRNGLVRSRTKGGQRTGPGRQCGNEMQQDSAGLDGTRSKTCDALTRHTPDYGRHTDGDAVFTRQEMEELQVSGYSDG